MAPRADLTGSRPPPTRSLPQRGSDRDVRSTGNHPSSFRFAKRRWPRRRGRLRRGRLPKPRGLVRLGMWWKVCLQGNPRPERRPCGPHRRRPTEPRGPADSHRRVPIDPAPEAGEAATPRSTARRRSLVSTLPATRRNTRTGASAGLPREIVRAVGAVFTPVGEPGPPRPPPRSPSPAGGRRRSGRRRRRSPRGARGRSRSR